MTFFKNLSVLFTGLILLACENSSQSSRYFDVPDLQGKTAAQVTRILGEPDTTYQERLLGIPHFMQRYVSKNDAEIRYKDGKLESIVIHKPYELPWQPEVISKYGFAYRRPNRYDTAAIFNWKDYEGFDNVSMYRVREKKPDDLAFTFKIYFDFP
ncbi:MAG: hypothetical protein KI790_06100 [Cyclobacteriaceae bacterium]|nr:hypothetical protein [Cyclobacteriaceae bacterium HetDA_MAG_MS6]